jgi:hypothetical protein
VIPPESPQYNVVLKGIIELSGSPKREELLAEIKQAAEPDPQQLAMQQREMENTLRGAEIAMQREQKEIEKLDAEIALIQEKTRHEAINADLEDEKIDIQAANAVIGREKAKAAHESNRVQEKKIRADAKKARKT